MDGYGITLSQGFHWDTHSILFLACGERMKDEAMGAMDQQKKKRDIELEGRAEKGDIDLWEMVANIQRGHVSAIVYVHMWIEERWL